MIIFYICGMKSLIIHFLIRFSIPFIFGFVDSVSTHYKLTNALDIFIFMLFLYPLYLVGETIFLFTITKDYKKGFANILIFILFYLFANAKWNRQFFQFSHIFY